MSITDLICLTRTIAELGNNLDWQSSAISSLLFAQFVENVDVLSNIQNAWQDFLQSGKAAALVVGLIAGYVIRGVTR